MIDFSEYLKENVDTVKLPDGKEVSYINDKDAISFIVNNGYYVFAKNTKNPKGKGFITKIIVVKDEKILEFIFLNEYSNIVHGDILRYFNDFVDFYITNRNKININIIYDKTNNVDKIRQSIVNVDFNNGTGRIFPGGNVVAVRGEKIDAMTIRSKFNSVAIDFNLNKVNDNWIFESSDEKTGKVKQRYYSDLDKEMDEVNPTFVVGKYKNLAPNLIMDKDWNNAIRVLRTGFINNIEIAKRTMNKNDFNSFIKNQLPKIRKASLYVGESIDKINFREYLNENNGFNDGDMGTIECHGEDSMSGVCPICEPHDGERVRYDEWVRYADWSIKRPKGHKSYQGDGIPFRHAHCGCRWVSDNGAEAPSIKDIE